MISENDLTVSEKTISKKRGRPLILTPEQKAMIEKVYPDLTTSKSIQNKWYLVRASNVIRGHEDLKWLFDRETHFIRETILTELGRIKDDVDLLSLAREVCELKPTSREAIRLIRNWKGGKNDKVDKRRIGSNR
jgi:hypothetical protein